MLTTHEYNTLSKVINKTYYRTFLPTLKGLWSVYLIKNNIVMFNTCDEDNDFISLTTLHAQGFIE